MPKKKQKQLNERMKNIKNLKHIEFDISNDLDAQITKINGQIKNCEYDLKINFPDNIIIMNKLEMLKQRKKELEKQKISAIDENSKEKENV